MVKHIAGSTLMLVSWGTVISLNYTWCVTEKEKRVERRRAGAGRIPTKDAKIECKVSRGVNVKLNQTIDRDEGKSSRARDGKMRTQRRDWRGKKETDGKRRKASDDDKGRGAKSSRGQCVLILTCLSCSRVDLTLPLHMRATEWTDTQLRDWITHTHTERALQLSLWLCLVIKQMIAKHTNMMNDAILKTILVYFTF